MGTPSEHRHSRCRAECVGRKPPNVSGFCPRDHHQLRCHSRSTWPRARRRATVHKAVFVGVAVAGMSFAGAFVSIPASAGHYCGPRHRAVIVVVPRTHSHWHHRRYDRRAFYGGAFYGPRVLAWRSWGDPRWGWRDDWRWRRNWYSDRRWQRDWRRDWGWARW